MEKLIRVTVEIKIKIKMRPRCLAILEINASPRVDKTEVSGSCASGV